MDINLNHLIEHVHYLGSYSTTYARHRIIQSGLRSLGISITEALDQSCLPLRWVRLAKAVREAPQDTPIIVGEASNYLSPVLFEAVRRNHPVVFDVFVSLLDTLEDRQSGWRRRSLAPILEWIDRINNRAAGAVILDTHQTQRYFVERLGLHPEKAYVAYVGAETALFRPRPRDKSLSSIFHVLFYGTFIPLQGVDVIVRAAAEVQRTRRDIRFQLVGSGQVSKEARELAQQLNVRNVDFGPVFVPYYQLPDLIAQADLCLGIFADRPKTKRVIPNKLYQCAAMGVPVVTGDTPAIREGFVDGEMALVPLGDYGALASEIVSLADSQVQRERIGIAGMRAVHQRYSPTIIASQVLAACRALYV